DGFIGRTLRLRLGELGHDEVANLTRATSPEAWGAALAAADVVFHLAGVNRPKDPAEFSTGNADLTAQLCGELAVAGRRAALVLTSSTQVDLNNAYGRSKCEAEAHVRHYAKTTGARACVLRLPNVFGKWARPHYNSAVSTFCHNIARGLPITIHDAAAPLRLVHVDTVVEAMLALLPPSLVTGSVDVAPVYETTVGEVAAMLHEFADSRRTLAIPRVGAGFARALYSTYVSYLPPDAFAYELVGHEDSRGAFSEMLRTSDSGQFSYFSAHPGVTRGGHYHHTKTEKFLVVHGRARFGFRHILTGERHVIDVEGTIPRVVEAVPGWAHNITNTGDNEMVVLLWANEAFDPQRPDAVASTT
ncbi:MAG TPA: NAD-dependent epimerase/dehydratase family protein, partial [Gemmatimonadaceae bacterium]|nr:NAD-dependent epimerase/dehydratase family protein [Gemmatimonadaceae bacterium]